MNRKVFLQTTALGLGGIFAMPSTGESFTRQELYEAFKNDILPDTLLDAIILGGSFAGLSAAMGLGRCRRSVLVIDTGLPRNRNSPQANNLFSRDGQNPREITREVKLQLEQYQLYLSMVQGTAVRVDKNEGSFSVETKEGQKYTSQTLILANGVTDNLLEIEGLEELWGRGVYHCPYCHGWENRDKKTVVIGEGNFALHFASVVSNWTNDITYFTQGVSVDIPEETRAMLTSLGVTINHGKVLRISKTDTGVQILLNDGQESLHFETCYAPGRITPNNGLAESLGCELMPNGAVVVNERYESTIEGVYAIGDLSSRSNSQVIHAAYSGTVAAASINTVFITRRLNR